MTVTDYTRQYLAEVRCLAATLDQEAIDRMISLLLETRSRSGRVFFLGVGGSAANASHAAADFRKICNIECYSPADNMAELTARINDEGWDTCYAEWLRASRLSSGDTVFVLSVGGGNRKHGVSMNLVHALDFAHRAGARILGVVSRDGGYTAQLADACIVVPTLSSESITPHAEEFQSVVWHLVVSHPLLRLREMKWESLR